MALTIARQDPKNISMGNIKAAVFKITSDGSTQYFTTGFHYILFAAQTNQTETGSNDQVVFNSNDGTEGSSNGDLWFTAEGSNDVTYYMVFGW